MNRSEVIKRLDRSLNWDEVEETFIHYWHLTFFLGEVTYFTLADRGYIGQTDEECFALILIGVARVLSKNVGECPGDAYQYYEAACKAIEEAPGYKSESDLTIKILDRPSN